MGVSLYVFLSLPSAVLCQGNLDAAEAGCAACLAAWPACSSGHLKMAKILRARGLSQQVCIQAGGGWLAGRCKN